MGKAKEFLQTKRRDVVHRPIDERIQDFSEIDLPLTAEQMNEQASRCMDCGIPFCHGVGCPVQNSIPDMNELVHKGKWRQACELLHRTNNFPEITGRVCPAPCETACTLSINDEAVLIRYIEFQIVEQGFKHGWIKPLSAEKKTGKSIAVIGSGPAGLAAAQQLARAGHSVIVFEKDDRIGGMLRYGIPDFKLEKAIIDRRLDQLIGEGIEFQTGVVVGEDISARYLKKRFDCLCLAMGTGQPRDLNVVGREHDNILFAMDYLTAQNRRCSGETANPRRTPNAKDKVVVVIGGGDTGSDCVGTAIRQGAKDVHQFEILPKPPDTRPVETPWPTWPRTMRTSSSHEEGCNRRWSVMTKEFAGVETRVTTLHCCEVEWVRQKGTWQPKELPGSDFTLDADIVLLAMGFLHVTHDGFVHDLGLDLDNHGNIATDNYQTSEPWVFAAGDATGGASLVVRAINSGRQAAAAINNWLKNT